MTLMGRGLRPRHAPRPGSSPGASDVEPRHPSSPVVERQRSVTESTLKPQGERTPRDRLIEVMTDGRYHSTLKISTLDFFKKPGDWVVELREAIDFGYMFLRRGNSLSMIKRNYGTTNQDLMELLAGIDATKDEDMNRLFEFQKTTPSDIAPPLPSVPGWVTSKLESSAEETLPEEKVFEPGSDVDALPRNTELLVLSTDGKSCVLSAQETVTSTRAILARKSSGKTYLGMVIAEEFLKLKMPFVVLDPMGVWHGLLALADGTVSPYQILILGGLHAHLPLRFGQGASVASLVVKLWPHPVILDLSEMVPEEQHEFVADFGSKLYAENRKALHVFIDEADEYMPQNPDSSNKHHRRCLNTMDRLVRRGRVRGLGTTVITQRPAVINKNVLSQIDGAYLMSMAAPHDLEAADHWMRPVITSAQERFECLRALPSMEQGQAFYMNSGVRASGLIHFTVRLKTTFDSTKTPSVSEPNPPVPTLSRPANEIVEFAASALGISSSD